MNTTTILSLARAKLLEEGTEILADATLLTYANLAYKDVIKRAFPNSAISSATVAFVSGVGSEPSDFGTLYSDAIDTNGNIFPEVSIADFVRMSETGERAITVEGGQLKVTPDTTTSLNIKYYPNFETLTAAVNPTIDEYLHEPIVYGTISRAFEDLQDPELSQFYENKFDTMLEKKINVLNNYELEAQRGGTMFNGISIVGNGNNSNPDKW